jgi:hypothetical protein
LSLWCGRLFELIPFLYIVPFVLVSEDTVWLPIWYTLRLKKCLSIKHVMQHGTVRWQSKYYGQLTLYVKP